VRRWSCKSKVKFWGSTPELLSILQDWSVKWDSGIPSVEVKFADIRRNAGGESGYLGYY
jgi:hypothetical protein